MDGRAMDNAKTYTQKVKNPGQKKVEPNKLKEQHKKKVPVQKPKEEVEAVSKWKPLPSNRKFPLWLRSIIFFVLVGISLCAGLMVGYSVVGDGESATTIFHKEIWEHILGFFK